ncbi:VOC family protein [Streptomyces purpureus]|uniref:Hydrolase n=1 Tax=Streptomyces purpureus TaxID=1951 RepID=A0A918GWY3_9ACTN|nr:VOC family protein [Streptomyces purpureus]GGT15213.1 hydrolase [Streptomyces purpureus]
MAVQPDGKPCWADAMFTDVEGAKAFYGDVLGWTFGEAASEFGSYTQAYRDGKAVAAVVPPMPGQDGEESRSAWCLYLASSDVAATARKIRDNGGTLLMEPMQVGDFGSMCLAQDPGGVVFGVWQGGTHEGFEKMGETGSYVWSEIFTRTPQESDTFFPAVFGYGVKTMAAPDVPEMDYKLYTLDDNPELGRMLMTGDFPPDVPSYIQVYFAVDDCDAAVAKAQTRGGQLVFGPMGSPFGRFAAIVDPQGAVFAVIDQGTTEGEMPDLR